MNDFGLEKFKIQYYIFMIKYYIHEKLHLDVAKSYQTIFDTYNKASSDLSLDPSGSLKSTSFSNFVLYLLLSPYTSEKVALLNTVKSSYPRELEQIEAIGLFVKKFLTFELLPLDQGMVQ